MQWIRDSLRLKHALNLNTGIILSKKYFWKCLVLICNQFYEYEKMNENKRGECFNIDKKEIKSILNIVG